MFAYMNDVVCLKNYSLKFNCMQLEILIMLRCLLWFSVKLLLQSTESRVIINNNNIL